MLNVNRQQAMTYWVEQQKYRIEKERSRKTPGVVSSADQNHLSGFDIDVNCLGSSEVPFAMAVRAGIPIQVLLSFKSLKDCIDD